MTLIKDMGKQVFIILREPNELVKSYSDKMVAYHYSWPFTLNKHCSEF